MEQGNHTELLAKGGVFASMWADQVSATEDTASSHRKDETLTGYAVDEDQVPKAEDNDATDGVLVETPEVQPVEIPLTGDVTAVTFEETERVTDDVPEAATEDTAKEAPAAVAFPSSDEAPSGPVEFPVADVPAAVTFPTTDGSEAPITFPSGPSDSPTPAPVAFAFPGSETSSQANTPSIGGTGSPGVTFQDAPAPARSPVSIVVCPYTVARDAISSPE